VTWEEWDRSTARRRRPVDWASRPDGPDQLDLIAAEAQAHGFPLGRGDLLAAMTDEARERCMS
jgi:hypothetical protein